MVVPSAVFAGMGFLCEGEDGVPMGRLCACFDALSSLLCPPRASCMGCKSLLGTESGWLCSDCQKALKPMSDLKGDRCPCCGMPLDKRGRCRTCGDWPEGLISFARSAFLYDGPIRGMIHAFKFNGVYRMAEEFGVYLENTMILEKMDRPDALIPVPMHKRRLRKRGLDHALLLARALGRRSGLPVWEGRLRRVKNTPQQAKSSASSRHTALAGAFLASGVGNSRILLVDDVMTTGSTALACAQTLLEAGAQSVQLITLAGAPIKGVL